MAKSDGRHWVRSPLATRHSQTALLLVSFAWGMSYLMPRHRRISWSEVFPEDANLVPMWAYGVALIGMALAALVGERLIMRAQLARTGWRCSFFAHSALFAIYATLALSAMLHGFREAGAIGWSAAGVISALSRPVLWGYVGYLHLTYARLPSPMEC